MTDMATDETSKAADSSNNNELTPESSLISHRRFTYRDTVDRRAMKQNLSDRRAEARFDETGTQQVDRRLANRLANIEKLRKTA